MTWLTFGLMGCASASDEVADSGTNDSANLCQSHADCASGKCSDGICVAVASALEAVTVEVIAPAVVNVGDYQQMRYLQTLELSSAGQFDFSLDYVASLVVGARSPSTDCVYSTADDKERLRVAVEALQNPGVNGIASNSYVGASALGASDNYATLRVPPGNVDLYIVPQVESLDAEPAGDCSLVPFLALGQPIEAGKVLFEQRLPVAQRLSIDISIPVNDAGKSPLEGFVLDLVEPLLGRRLSSQVTLVPGAIELGVAHHVVELAYQPVVGAGAAELSGRELFRFTPPKGLVAPALYVAKVATDLFGDGQISISQVAKVPNTVAVSGAVESETGAAPVVSQITAVLRSAGDSSTSAIAQFTASTTTDEQGRFEFELVAGDYDFVATPLYENRFASRVGLWSISSDAKAQTDMNVTLPAKSSLTGRVVGSEKELAAIGANVVAVPSTIGQPATFIDNLLDNTRNLGRRSAAVPVELDGAFELGVDSGSYDVFICPATESGYPWVVRPNTVAFDGPVGLGAIQLSAPFAFSGLVKVRGTSASGDVLVLPGALIRAYALFDTNGRLVGDLASANSAVQIAEARANSVGEYSLLLPATLN